MAAVIELNTAEEALALFEAARSGEDFDDVKSIKFGQWVNTFVKLELGLHSEMTPPFMEAFIESQNSIYRLAALVKYGAADIRHLSQSDLDAFQIRVKVSDGSSDMLGQFAETLTRLGEAALDKLTPIQTMIFIGGLSVLISGSFGFASYVEYKKEMRKEEIQSTEKRQLIEGLTYASKQQSELASHLINYMEKQGAIGARAVSTAAQVHGAMLKAASQTPEADINGHHLTRNEAKEIRVNARRAAIKMIVEREMRVVDINTSDPAHTVVVVEDTDGRAQHRLQFTDRLVQDRDHGRLFESLRMRTTLWLRLDVKDVGGELRILDILGVVSAPDDTKLASASPQDGE